MSPLDLVDIDVLSIMGLALRNPASLSLGTGESKSEVSNFSVDPTTEEEPFESTLDVRFRSF